MDVDTNNTTGKTMRTHLPVTATAVEVTAQDNILSTTALKGRITYFNPDSVRISGYETQELFGDHYWVDAFTCPLSADGKTVAYQSVRSKPAPEYIKRTERLYSLLRNGKTLKFTSLSLYHRLLITLAVALLPALLGCAPHPAAGTWSAASGDFSRLEITYEGRALLYAAGEETASRHCFWGGESALSIALTCKPAFDTSSEERYRLAILADGSAELTRDGTVQARLSRQDK